MPRPRRLSPSSDHEQDIPVDDHTANNSASDTVVSKKTKKNGRKSYVWSHFVTLTDKGVNKCKFIMKNNEECGKELKKEASSSTKSMKTHLANAHGIRDPEENQTDLVASFKKVKTNHIVSPPDKLYIR